MEQWNSEEKSESFEGWLCGSDSDIIDAILDFLTEVGLNKEKSSLTDVLKELYFIQILEMMNLNDIKELTNNIKKKQEGKFDNVIAEIEKECEKIDTEENNKIEFKQDWANFYSNKKKDIWAIIDGVTGEKRPKVKKYEFSEMEKVIFWEILMQRKLLNKLKTGKIDTIDKDEMDVVDELLKLFATDYNQVEKRFCKSQIECKDAFEKLKDAMVQCKELLDDEKYIELVYDVSNDIVKIIEKMGNECIMKRIELRIKKRNKENEEN